MGHRDPVQAQNKIDGYGGRQTAGGYPPVDQIITGLSNDELSGAGVIRNIASIF